MSTRTRTRTGQPAYVTTNTGRRIAARYGFDPIWTSHFAGYALRLHTSDAEAGNAACKPVLTEVRVDRAASGWAVVIGGEAVETFPTKTDAQCAAEELLGVR